MDISDKIQFAKVLEDRINVIENSYANSFLETPINLLQSRLIDDVEEIGLEYLLNYQTTRLGNAINMGIYASEFYPIINNAEKYKEDANAISLKHKDNCSELSKLLDKRRSIRKYINKNISFETFSDILINAQNMKKRNNFYLKNSPSGGGLYPIDLYVYTNKVETLPQDLFLFQPISKTLKLVNTNCKKSIEKILSNQTVLDLNNYAAIVFFSFDYVKTYQKYSDLALSLGFIEIGAIAQSIHLLSTLYGLGSCDIGGFDKPYCEKTLKLDGINKHAVYAIILGRLK